MLNWSPTAMVASNTKDGIGTKGISDPKNLLNLNRDTQPQGQKERDL